MEWHFQNDAPIYTQLVTHFRLGIASGDYTPGERLSSVRELALTAGVNPNTMQRALSELERDGLVHSQRTTGRFVTEDANMIETVKKELAQTYIRRFVAEMTRLGYEKKDLAELLNSQEEEQDGQSGM